MHLKFRLLSIDGLGDAALFSQACFAVLDFVPAVEDGYVADDRARGVSAAWPTRPCGARQ